MGRQVREIYLYDGSVAREKILEAMRDAKAKLGWEFLLKPVWTDGTAFARVIAFEQSPHFMDHILIGPEMDSDAIVDALRWAVLGEHSEAAQSAVDGLMEILGFGVRELDPSEMKEYTQQQDLKKASHRLKFEVKGDSRDGYR